MKGIKGFFHGVKKEADRIHWPKGKELTKYSVVTLVLIVFFALYFLGLDSFFVYVKDVISNG